MSPQRIALLVAACSFGGCNGDDAVTDAALPRDGSGPDGSGVALPWLEDGVPPIGIAPCPDGWREVDDGSGITTCDPYSEPGALDCPNGEAHFPGEPGCAPVGSSCAAGDFSETLPADANIVYVQPGAGGDGSSSTSPYGSLTGFSFAALPVGTVIALSRGTHTGPVRLTRGVVLWGACAAETVLSTTEPSETDAVVTARGAPGELRDLTVADSPRAGVSVFGSGADVVFEGVVVRGTETVAVGAIDDARLMARALVVRATRSGSRDGLFGRGLTVERGATADFTRLMIEQSRELGLYAGGTDTSVVLADAVVRDTEGQASDGLGGRALNVQDGARVELSRVLVARSRDTGVYAGGTGSAVVLSDVVVRDTEPEVHDGQFGRGLSVELGATAELHRVIVERSHDVGVAVFDPGATVALSDVIVRDTAGRETDGMFGRGVNVQAGATVELGRVLVERGREVGVVARDEGTAVVLSDVVVRDTEGQASDGKGGRGMSVQGAAMAELDRVLVERNRDIGVFTMDAGTTVKLSDTVVRDTLPRLCAATTCAEAPSGTGVVSLASASLSLSRFLLQGAHLCGVHVARDGEVDLVDGEVRENPIGVCLQVGGYDEDRLTRGVAFIDNDVNIQATTLPLPELAEAIPAP
jgi:hypothetical protein